MSPWVPVLVALVVSVVPALVGFGVLRSRVERQGEDVERLWAALEKQGDRLADLRERVAEDTGTHRLPGGSGGRR